MKRLIQLGAFVLALAIAIPALAMGLEEAKQKLDTAKQQGLVGETPTGYLDVVRAEGDAQAVVAVRDTGPGIDQSNIGKQRAQMINKCL